MKVTELEIKENADGELYFNIPDDVLSRLGWEEGDEIKFTEKNGGFVLTKVKYETIELDFNDEELLTYMMHAHKEGISFNNWVENVLEEYIKLEDEKMLDKLNRDL
jgi:bifunctional DNA-binding transcriptional regulator/antitoxin component of YhaV-PrlF toxin-antitoxin module